jgi:MFS family permease
MSSSVSTITTLCNYTRPPDLTCFADGIVVPVLPFALTKRSGVKPDQVQTWISIFLAVYGAALLAAAPVFGWVADRSSSRRMPLLFGLLALGGSTAMLCVGDSIGMLAAGRVLQGVSAAVVWVVGLALLVDTVGSEGVGQAMGYIGLSMSLAILLAPLLGGIVFDTAGYYAVFAMAFGLIVLDILLRLFMIEKKVAVRWLPEAAPARVPTETAKDGKNDAEAQRQSTATDIELAPTAGASRLSNRVESEAEPLPVEQPSRLTRLPPVLYLFTSRRILNALWACMIQASLLTAFDSMLPLFVRDTFHWNSIGAGLIFLPIVIVSFLGPPIGYASDRVGPRWFATAGFIIACPFLILLRLVDTNTIQQKVLLCALLALFGTAMTLVLTPMMAEITYAVDNKAQRHPPGFFGKNGAYAQAYSLFNMAWAGGCLVGPLIGGLINQRAGWGTATLVLGLISIITAVPTAIWTGGSIFKERQRRLAIAAREERRQD